jgi:hypothetical protein
MADVPLSCSPCTGPELRLASDRVLTQDARNGHPSKIVRGSLCSGCGVFQSLGDTVTGLLA